MAQNEDSKRSAPVISNERPSPMDRVRQIQELQRAAEAQPSAPAKQSAASALSATVSAAPQAAVANVFEARPVTPAAVKVPRPDGDQAVYARAQVASTRLFGADAAEPTGNPWKVIDFNTQLPALFQPPRPLADYEAKVPANALQTDEGLLFQVALAPRDGAEAPLQRAVLTAPTGELIGAECRSLKDLSGLLARAPGMAEAIATAAFGGGAEARLGAVSIGKRGGFEVAVLRGVESKAVALNNFGQPSAPGRGFIDVAGYHLDRFEAAA